MPQIIGSIELPIYTDLPPTGQAGQICRVAGTLYHWDGGQWVALWPLFIGPAAPSSTSVKYLWVNTSGADPTLWVEDGL